MAGLSPRRRRMIENMTARNVSPATQRSDIHHVAEFSRLLTVAGSLGYEEVHTYHLRLVSRRVTWGRAKPGCRPAVLLWRDVRADGSA